MTPARFKIADVIWVKTNTASREHFSSDMELGKWRMLKISAWCILLKMELR